MCELADISYSKSTTGPLSCPVSISPSDCNLHIEFVPETQYAISVGQFLSSLLTLDISVEQEICLLILCPKLKSFEAVESPIFVFYRQGADDNELRKTIIEWADSFQNKHLFLPNLRMQYAFTFLSQIGLEGILSDHDHLISRKWKHWGTAETADDGASDLWPAD